MRQMTRTHGYLYSIVSRRDCQFISSAVPYKGVKMHDCVNRSVFVVGKEEKSCPASQNFLTNRGRFPILGHKATKGTSKRGRKAQKAAGR